MLSNILLHGALGLRIAVRLLILHRILTLGVGDWGLIGLIGLLLLLHHWHRSSAAAPSTKANPDDAHKTAEQTDTRDC